jgi:carbon starvation protein
MLGSLYTVGPGLFILTICIWSGYLNITQNVLPKGFNLLASLSVILMLLMTVVFVEAFKALVWIAADR